MLPQRITLMSILNLTINILLIGQLVIMFSNRYLQIDFKQIDFNLIQQNCF